MQFKPEIEIIKIDQENIIGRGIKYLNRGLVKTHLLECVPCPICNN